MCINNDKSSSRSTGGLFIFLFVHVLRQIDAVVANGQDGPRAGTPEAGAESAADRRHAFGWTALMTAAANDQPSAVRELLKLGAKPDLQERLISYTT